MGATPDRRYRSAQRVFECRDNLRRPAWPTNRLPASALAPDPTAINYRADVAALLTAALSAGSHLLRSCRGRRRQSYESCSTRGEQVAWPTGPTGCRGRSRFVANTRARAFTPVRTWFGFSAVLRLRRGARAPSAPGETDPGPPRAGPGWDVGRVGRRAGGFRLFFGGLEVGVGPGGVVGDVDDSGDLGDCLGDGHLDPLAECDGGHAAALASAAEA